MDFKGKTAIVTGATRGIGRAIALLLGKQGAFVYGTATSIDGKETIQQAFQDNEISGRAFVLDVKSPESIQQLMDEIAKNDQQAGILVNNAGITADNLLLRMEEDEWSRVIETNLTSVYRMTHACLKGMFRARWGRIINIGSVVGSSGNSGQVNYAAAKAGLLGFSKSLAQEMASRGITVNVVAPGFIETDMTASLPTVVQDELLKRIPMKQLGQPKDVAAAVVFLASEGARYITGQVIHVNGGMYM
ncbi:MAG: 3-oxoacyl-[acyl-carrier-protein] reductase [Legionellales bacterium RIFCSPHIGHO2_12_FULL_37_14]|nr:MAG: 3-oxoacyl-[acyl-carrier-protein] reductase [Legionellales bacterium RIFCSPHIGHO2_12_FULL_37_14]